MLELVEVDSSVVAHSLHNLDNYDKADEKKSVMKTKKKTSKKSNKSKSTRNTSIVAQSALEVPLVEPEGESRKEENIPPPAQIPPQKPTHKRKKLPGLSKRKKNLSSNDSQITQVEVYAEPGLEEKKEKAERLSLILMQEQVEAETKPVENVSESTAQETDNVSSRPHHKRSKRKSSSKKKSSTTKSPKSSKKDKKKRKKSKSTNNRDDDDEDIGLCDPFFLEASEEGGDFICLTEADIIAEQTREIEEVAEVLSVTSSAAITLLKYFKWNRDKLMTSYFDNPLGVLKKAGVSKDTILPQSDAKPSIVLQGNQFECSICSFDVDLDEVHTLLPCNHTFCKDCWEQYLTLQITEGQVYINCPHMNCLSLIQENTVKLLVREEIYRKYCTFFMQSFVDNNDNVKWCPAPGCGNAVTSDMIHGQTVTCHCMYRFCFQCSEEAHLPATCDQVREWKKKCQDESETNNWIAANTQECPKCGLPTEKNGGCNHMTCRQCKYEYCWICTKDWKGHNDFYTCNRYQKSKEDKKSKKSSRKEREQQRIAMRKALEKYLHYYSRFMNHTKSSELERIREKALMKMQEMQETEATAAEVLFIKQASDRLVECRSVLKYSYVAHYFMNEEDPQRDLLEYLQEDLEKTVENLSEVMEHPMKHKMDIVNLTRLACTRMNNLLDASGSNC